MSCRICTSPVRLYARKNGFEVMQCTQCGFGQVDVTPEVLASFYDKSYFDGEKAHYAQEENVALPDANRYWIEMQLAPLAGRGPLRVLEIGPGLGGPIAGYFERERKDVQYTGVEFSEYAAERLRSRGLDVHTGRVVDPAILESCRGQYDLVFGTEVIEHDLEPHAFLGAVYAMLKPGGRAAFTTGNLDGGMARWKKTDWYYLDPPAHVSFYTARSARKALEMAGFRNVDVTRFGFNHIRIARKLHMPFLMRLVDMANISTGMTMSGERV
jgi:cyclopropane fatty-acyl-phospholipid synthase-like methyltransferase